MVESRPIGTPMVTGYKFYKDNSIEVNETLYRSTIGKLQYEVHRKPDIAHAVGIVVTFSANPKETHMNIVKIMFRYLKGTKYYGLWNKKEWYFELRVYTNIDWVRNVDDKKSTSGGALFLGEILVTWIRRNRFVSHNPLLKLSM